MTWQGFLTLWVVIGFLSCVWAVYDDHQKGNDFELFDLFLVVVTSFTGPIFTIWLIKEWMKQNTVVLVKGKQRDN